jgi:hypothetical protein
VELTPHLMVATVAAVAIRARLAQVAAAAPAVPVAHPDSRARRVVAVTEATVETALFDSIRFCRAVMAAQVAAVALSVMAAPVALAALHTR